MALDDPDGARETAGVAVDLADVSKTYDAQGTTVEALSAVSFSVDPGEFVCVVGPSGSGKTTLFRTIGGLEAPTSGHVSVAGDRVTGPTQNVGMVFQEYHLFPWRTVRENVAFGLEQQDVPVAEREARVADLLELVGLSGFADAYPKELSGGMKQRTGIARALAVDPDLLLLDEPFGAVDAQTRTTLQDELLDLWGETGKTVLFVTHDVEEAVTLADRVVVMDAEPGRVREVVSIDLARPRSRSDEQFGDAYERVLDLIRA